MPLGADEAAQAAAERVGAHGERQARVDLAAGAAGDAAEQGELRVDESLVAALDARVQRPLDTLQEREAELAVDRVVRRVEDEELGGELEPRHLG